MIKNLPAIQETLVRSLGWEDPLEEGMATHSDILAQRIPWTEEPGMLSPWVAQSQTQMKRLSSSPGGQQEAALRVQSAVTHLGLEGLHL